MSWAGHVARIGEVKYPYNVFVGESEGKRPLRRSRQDGRIILKWILGKHDWRVWIGFNWQRIVTSGEML
jgi:hypothetical protein